MLKSQGGAATTQEPCVEVLDMHKGDDFLYRNFNWSSYAQNIKMLLCQTTNLLDLVLHFMTL